METNDLQFDLRELIRAAEMAGISPTDIPSNTNPWSWKDPRAFSWRSNFRSINPSVAQQAEIQLGEPLSLALQAAMDAGETLSTSLARELKVRRPQLHEQLHKESIERALERIKENRAQEQKELAARTPSQVELAEQLQRSKDAAIRSQQGQHKPVGPVQ